ncbi:MAG: hypothetical protein ACKKMP_03375 [Candidatus Nealsonbacteria bacterium]
MEQIILKEEFDELLKLKGEVKGTGIKTHGEFILKEEGEEGLKKLEDVMLTLGHPIKFREIKATTSYPFGVEAVILLAIKRLFNYDDKKFQEIGRFHSKSSLIIRLFMKHFVSLERVAKESSQMWRRYFTVGDIEVVEIDKEKRRIIFKVKNFKFHPLHCQILNGSIATIIQMIIGHKVTAEETKCIHRGDEYHEFLLKW